MKKKFPGQNLCSGAFGGNNRPYTKQRARHGSPFLEPPPLSFAGRPCHPPPKAIFGPPRKGMPCISQIQNVDFDANSAVAARGWSRAQGGTRKEDWGGGGSETRKLVYQQWPALIFSSVNFSCSHYEMWVCRGSLARGHGVRLFAFGGACWPLATAHPDPLWVRTCCGCINGAPG